MWRRCLLRFAIILVAIGLSGCFATMQQVAGSLSNTYVGQNVDLMVTRFGPPATSFKMNSGETAYMWQLSALTDIDTYRGIGTAQTFFCKIDVVASAAGIVTKLTTEDARDGFDESLCAKRLDMERGKDPFKL